MKLRPLMVSLGDLTRLATYAEQHPFSMDDLLDMFNSGARIGDNPNHRLLIPVGYCVCYSVEEQNPGLMRHLSMSVDEDGVLPSIESVALIMRLLGFKNKLEECIVAVEPINPVASGKRECINVLEVIK